MYTSGYCIYHGIYFNLSGPAFVSYSLLSSLNIILLIRYWGLDNAEYKHYAGNSLDKAMRLSWEFWAVNIGFRQNEWKIFIANWKPYIMKTLTI